MLQYIALCASDGIVFGVLNCFGGGCVFNHESMFACASKPACSAYTEQQ